jgi:hypothetical protein
MFDLPDATVNVLQGILFLSILVSDTFRGRSFSFATRRRAPEANAPKPAPAAAAL